MRRMIKSKDRVKNQGEVFTPAHIVKDMLDMVGDDISDKTKRILEPACGDGNFLVDILQRRLDRIPRKLKIDDREFEVLIILSNIYGIDIMQDNVIEARSRLFGIVNTFFSEEKNSAAFLIAANTIIEKNTIRGDSLKHKADIKVLEWKPILGLKGFEINPHTLAQIENDMKDVVVANSLADIKTVVDEIFMPKPSPKTIFKPRKELESQKSLFDINKEGL